VSPGLALNRQATSCHYVGATHPGRTGIF
jgi:hypothetical protein